MTVQYLCFRYVPHTPPREERRGAGKWGGGSGWEAGKDSTPSPLRIIGVSVYHQLNRLPSKSRAWEQRGCLQAFAAGIEWGWSPSWGTSLGYGGAHSKPLPCWQWGGPQALVSLPMMKAESHFQADAVSQDAARSFAKEPEEQEDGARKS